MIRNESLFPFLCLPKLIIIHKWAFLKISAAKRDSLADFASSTYQTMSKTKNSLDSTDSSDDAGGDNDNCVANERELR